MRARLFLTMSVLVLGLGAAADGVIMQCDVGGCGAVQAGWTSLASCGTQANVAGSGIDVTLTTGNPAACSCRDKGGTGTLADVETDLLFADDEQSSPGADFIITFSNLTPGASYRLFSYHNRSDEGTTTIPGVTVTGATNVTTPSSIVQDHAIMDNPAEVLFTAGSGDVVVQYLAPTGGCSGCQVFLNGFKLEYAGPTVGFAASASGAIETIGTAYVEVSLTNPEPGETYTVQYNVIGGTADGGGIDYTITPGTIIFDPGETLELIAINIVNDPEQEVDETILLELFNETGLFVVPGITQHTFTISDSAPKVSFESAGSSGFGHTSPVHIEVNLSHVSGDTVTANYAVTGGSAEGSDYTLLGDGTLTFDPGVTTLDIDMLINDDSTTEPSETIQISLSNFTNALAGTFTQHTYTIIDNEEGLVWDDKLWFYSGDISNLFVNGDGDLEWSPEKGEQFMTRIPDIPLTHVGDAVDVSFMWMTDGDHDCPDCFACPGCYDDDITCIAGTSDIRVGLFEADGEYVQADGFDVEGSSIFAGYKGYAFRFGPNMLAGPTRWVDCIGEGEVHKTGDFAKKPVDRGDFLFLNDDILELLPGLELPPGEYALLTVRIERTGSSDVEMTISLGDKGYSYTDTSSSGQPSKIDVLSIHMRNGRPYSRLVLRKVCRLAGNFDGNNIVDVKDFKLFVSWWLEQRCEGNECEVYDIHRTRRIDLRDFAVFAGQWKEDCP